MQMPELPIEDDEVYFGYELGAIGIVESLLEVLRADLYSESTNDLLFNSIIKSMETVWNSRADYEEDKIAAWGRGPHLDASSIFPGVKYGAAGIIPVFLDLYEYTDNIIWLSRAKESADGLIAQSVGDDIRWPYSYSLPSDEFGLALTGIKYGSAGIANTFLDLYAHTDDSKYLDYVESILDYLISIKREIKVGFSKYNVVTWYKHPSANINPVYTGYRTGIVGIAELMVKYGKIVNEQSWIDFADEMMQFLIKIQQRDGSWYYEYDYENIIMNNYDEGVAGIVYGLHLINNELDDNDIADAIIKGIEWLFSNYISNSTHTGFYTDNNHNKMLNSYYTGNLGIIDVLIKLESYLDTEQLEKLQDAVNWILSDGVLFMKNSEDYKFMFLKQSVENKLYFDLSYSTGNAGFISTLLDWLALEMPVNYRYNLTISIFYLLTPLLYYQRTDGLWNRQVFLRDAWNVIEVPTIYTVFTSLPDRSSDFYSISFIIVLPILAVIQKKYRNW